MGVTKKSLSLLTISCGVLLAISAGLSMKGSQGPAELECQKLILKGPDGKPAIVLDATSSVPTVSILDKKGGANIVLTGGDSPAVSIKNRNQDESISLMIDKDQLPMLVFKDKKNLARMQIQGGDSPAIFLKNHQNEIVGTMLLLQDGGAAVGLADNDGDVAAFMRGGSSPSVSFFRKSVEPTAAVGISQNVPHFLLSSPATSDSIILHGGDPTSVLFVDDKGEVPVLLSKHGLFQGKEESSAKEEKQDSKIFTKDDFIHPLKDTKLNAR
jgi:hypothetical protein